MLQKTIAIYKQMKMKKQTTIFRINSSKKTKGKKIHPKTDFETDHLFHLTKTIVYG